MKDFNRLRGLVALNSLRQMPTGATRSIRLAAHVMKERQIDLHFIAVRSIFHFVQSLWGGGKLRYKFVLFNGLASIGDYSRFGYFLWRWAIWRRVPLFMYWHEMDWVWERHKRESPQSARRIESLIRKESVQHLAASQAVADFLAQRFGVSSIPIYECALGFSELDELTMPEEPPLVINVASVQARKGVDLFVETAVKVCQQHPTVTFMWLGNGSIDAAMQEKIKQAGLQTRIRFPGYVQDPTPFFRRASVFFLSSRDDPFPLSNLEAMSYGRSIVTFNTGGAPEALAGHGRLIPPFDTNAAADTILSILQKPPAERLLPVLRQRYQAYYTPEKFADRLARIIHNTFQNK
ncbi:MAG: glycosyltransferase family 4 protein [Anaerolineales bacterium]|nr:glycosyltransferase family 4 protein [Anaerolineales bacterium]MCB8989451.1 glycosyltransferase family 4 protein [Ardenticatenaceae bacterium]MCB9005011.1 glycosyltransferase family 4 protein [Ardenticatenaceae bacterium]